MQKLMILRQGDFVALRFDLATEILLFRFENGVVMGNRKEYYQKICGGMDAVIESRNPAAGGNP